jgi:hypothetical protein
MPSLFRHRDFVLLWSGQSVSELGSSVTGLALPLVAVVVLHASAFEVSLLTAATSIAWLVIGLPAGVWVDRLPRRPVLIGTDLGRALLMATVPVAWSLHVLTVAHLVVVAFTVGLLSVLFDIGYPAYLPSVITRQRLVEGNSTLAASESAAGAVPLSLGIAAFNVCVRAAMQTAAPDAMLGRVTATVRLFSRSAIPAGALGAGALASLLTPRATPTILMALLVMTPAWLLLSPIGQVRDVAELAPLQAPPDRRHGDPQVVLDRAGGVNQTDL